jgi:hypothetical protein
MILTCGPNIGGNYQDYLVFSSSNYVNVRFLNKDVCITFDTSNVKVHLVMGRL